MPHTDDASSNGEHTVLLRAAGLRVTKPRLAVLDVIRARPHARTDEVIAAARSVTPVSTQAVYDVLAALTAHGVLRRIQPAGSLPRYELRASDNHHHVVCRACGNVTDIDCAVGAAPCLAPLDLDQHTPGFALDQAEVTYWGVCASCQAASDRTAPEQPVEVVDPNVSIDQTRARTSGTLVTDQQGVTR